jgi:hypothetical protein
MRLRLIQRRLSKNKFTETGYTTSNDPKYGAEVIDYKWELRRYSDTLLSNY